MNKKINKLIKKATKTVKREGAPGDWHSVKVFDQEKFAELLINECARIASHFSIENKRIHPDIDPRAMPDANQMVYHSTCQSVAWEIREQFDLIKD